MSDKPDFDEGAKHLRLISASLSPDPLPNTRPQKVTCSICGINVAFQSYHAPEVVAPVCDSCATRENSGPEERRIATWLPRLEQHFHVQREVWGAHFSGKSLRVDAVIRPKDVSEWKNKDAAFAVEFKRYVAADWGGDGARWAAQCVDYAHTKWNNYGALHVLIAGGFDPRPIPRDDPKDPSTVMPRMLGHLGVGELRLDPRDGLSIILHGRHKIWMESIGAYEAKRNGLERKWGAR